MSESRMPATVEAQKYFRPEESGRYEPEVDIRDARRLGVVVDMAG